jgi:hypothetical protein
MGVYDEGAKIVVLNPDTALELLGDMEMVKNFMTIFIDESLEGNLDIMHKAMMESDAVQVEKISHKIKGSSA